MRSRSSVFKWIQVNSYEWSGAVVLGSSTFTVQLSMENTNLSGMLWHSEE